MSNKIKSVLISGGSGLIGRRLTQMLITQGYQIHILSRKKELNIPNVTVHHWDVNAMNIDADAVNVDAIVHLAGAGIFDRGWTEVRKKELIDSRVKSAELIYQAVEKSGTRPQVFVSASGVGFYGMVTTDQVYQETDAPGNDLLSEICIQWEAAAKNFDKLGIRSVQLRTGLVVSKESDSIKKMMLPIKMYVGSPLGSGKQYMPWIHIDDLCKMYIQAMNNEQMQGPYNAIAPQQVTNRDFTKTLASAMNKPMFLPAVPAFVLRTIFNTRASLFLEGSRMSADKILNAGFEFQYPDLDGALAEVVG